MFLVTYEFKILRSESDVALLSHKRTISEPPPRPNIPPEPNKTVAAANSSQFTCACLASGG